ncbi:uncharacterized protein LOC132620044 [Lycium barbarum]|uniref:uncharacterized protein LOC132620044 n=1 Tax=Lycium barbarum TaxID=112863 RepID=UPI00293F2A66|nr:uncharacterized protein LOC132620044 [Lycium barbarum]
MYNLACTDSVEQIYDNEKIFSLSFFILHILVASLLIVNGVHTASYQNTYQINTKDWSIKPSGGRLDSLEKFGCKMEDNVERKSEMKGVEKDKRERELQCGDLNTHQEAPPPAPTPIEPGKQATPGGNAWATLFKGNQLAEQGMGLTFIAPLIKMERRASLERLIATRWPAIDKPKVYYHNDSYFVVRFECLSDRSEVLYAGPQMWNNHPIIIRAWTPDFDFAKEVLKTIPLWGMAKSKEMQEEGVSKVPSNGAPSQKGWQNPKITSKSTSVASNSADTISGGTSQGFPDSSMPTMNTTSETAMEPLFSNHSSLSLICDEQRRWTPKPFIFFNYMADHQDFPIVVAECWRERSFTGTLNFIWQKLIAVKNDQIAHGNHPELVEVEKTLRKEYEKWAQIEESIIRQKSRVQWLRFGDSNSSFFFANMKSRAAQNRIASLTNDTKEILGTSSSSIPAIQLDVIKDGTILNKDQQLLLIQGVTDNEMSQAMNAIIVLKAPGTETTKAVKHFFESCLMPRPVNCASVSLIPKVKNPTAMKEYRPISCYTILYKIISKVITARLQQVMPLLVENTQTAFVPGRLINDNIILSHELVKGYGRKGISSICMLKIDMQKAYDSIEWLFLEQVLVGLSFPDKFFRRVMVCVTTVNYSIFINGKQTESFAAKRGLRKGDPLSPYLFVLCMEYLNRLLKTLRRDPDFTYHPRCSRLHIVQLGFADDLLQFCKGDIKSVEKLFACFQKFFAASGLISTIRKSCVYFGGIDYSIQQVILDRLQFSQGTLPLRFLGVPSNTKRLSVIHCVPLIDKIIGRIIHWSSKLLSYAGRVQLLKTFLWTGDTEASKKELVASEQLCIPRTVGGMNILRTHAWNKTAICKMLWNLCKKKDKLWVKWVHAYYLKGQPIWNFLPKQGSWMLKKIFKATQTLEEAG